MACIKSLGMMSLLKSITDIRSATGNLTKDLPPFMNEPLIDSLIALVSERKLVGKISE